MIIGSFSDMSSSPIRRSEKFLRKSPESEPDRLPFVCTGCGARDGVTSKPEVRQLVEEVYV